MKVHGLGHPKIRYHLSDSANTSVVLSYIEIEETASVGELRAKLLRQGWLGELARCDDPKCSGETFCAWNQAVFPR